MIRFLVDYRGTLTGEQFYTAGTEVDGLPYADQLVAAGRAELVTVAVQEIEPPPPAPKRRTRKAG